MLLDCACAPNVFNEVLWPATACNTSATMPCPDRKLPTFPSVTDHAQVPIKLLGSVQNKLYLLLSRAPLPVSMVVSTLFFSPYPKSMTPTLGKSLMTWHKKLPTTQSLSASKIWSKSLIFSTKSLMSFRTRIKSHGISLRRPAMFLSQHRLSSNSVITLTRILQETVDVSYVQVQEGLNLQVEEFLDQLQTQEQGANRVFQIGMWKSWQRWHQPLC